MYFGSMKCCFWPKLKQKYYQILSQYVNQKIENLWLQFQAWFVIPVCHHVQNVSQNSHVIFRVEYVRDLLVFVHIVQNLLKQV